jgi:hypothetical protein
MFRSRTGCSISLVDFHLVGLDDVALLAQGRSSCLTLVGTGGISNGHWRDSGPRNARGSVGRAAQCAAFLAARLESFGVSNKSMGTLRESTPPLARATHFWQCAAARLSRRKYRDDVAVYEALSLPAKRPNFEPETRP